MTSYDKEHISLLDEQARERIRNARRVVVKFGTRLLVASSGCPEHDRMKGLVAELVKLHRNGLDVILVSSGAVGAGIDALGLTQRPENLPDLQMAAAVGQSKLMAWYDKLFGQKNCRVGQVLLTHEDLKSRTRHLNARNTLMNLLRHRIIPIVNENDVISVDEIRLGDNDFLAALTALLVDADVLMLMTRVNGLRKSLGNGRTERIPYVEQVNDQILSYVGDKGSPLSTGGMLTKLEAAEMFAKVGGAAVIADGRKPENIYRIINGEDVGTRIGGLSESRGTISSKKRWIAFFNRVKGSVVIDSGARKALAEGGNSLLPIGIEKVEGNFPEGSVVAIRDSSGELVARGLSSYSSADIERIMRKRTSEIKRILGTQFYEEVVHRDNMVVFGNGK